MKPFNIELAKKGEKVITRCGLKAVYEYNEKDVDNKSQIYGFGIYNNFNICILFKYYHQQGKCYNNRDSDFDLFMADDSDFQSKDEKPVYYRGDPERGDEIIADLIKRGGDNLYSENGKDKDAIYFINQFGFISYQRIFNHIKDHLDRFTELHLPPKKIKIKKEGWMNLCRSKIDKSYWLDGIYDSEKEAKNAKFQSSECLKTYKIECEEE